MKKIFALTFCILLCLVGAAQNYTYQAWKPSMGSLTFNTLGDTQHPWVQCKTGSSWNNPTTIVTPNNTSISNPSSAVTTHAIITSNQEDPCRCYQLGTYRHERYLPPSWDLDYNDLQDTVIRIGCGVNNSTCNHASQIEYWFYPEEQNSTLLVMFSFALINACGNYCSHGVLIGSTSFTGSSIGITNPQFYIEVFDGETGQLLNLGKYPTQASQGTANPIPNPNWHYSQFLAWPSGGNANLDAITGPDDYGVRTYYWAGQTNSNGSGDANGYATPTNFDYFECPESQTGGNSDGYPVQWFQYKPLAFNLRDIASRNVDANGRFAPVKSVKLRIRTVGCSATAHWAYGLFTAKMIPGIINADVCGDVSTIDLSVPAGLDERTYEWKYGYDSTHIVGLIDPTSPITGVSIPSVYGISIDQNAQENAGRVWPYYRCEMRSYTGVPFVYEAFIKKYYLEPDFTFKQKFENCELRAQLIDSSLIYTKTPPTTAGGNWNIAYENTIRHIQWFVKNYQTSQPNNDRFDSIPNRYGDTNFTYVFNYPHIDTLTGEAFIKIVIQDSLQICIKDTIKRIQLDLKAIRDTLTRDTVYTCEEKLPYVFDRAYFGTTHTWSTEGTRRVTYDTLAWNGCDSIVDVTLYVRKPKVDITSDPDYCEAFTTNLTAECADTVLQYLWDNGETAQSTTVTAPGTYTVEIMNQDSCLATGSIVIPACKPFLNLPNSISPSNQDGVNDYFFIPQSNLIKELEFTAFNRHGVMIYHTTNKDFEWNGTENGKLYIGVTYNYILRIVDYEGVASIHKGSITIL